MASDESRTSAAWDSLAKTFHELIAKEADFFRMLRDGSLSLSEFIEIIRNAFERDRSWAAMYYMDRLGPEVVRSLLPNLVKAASFASGSTGRVNQIILTLPREELVRDAAPMMRSLLADGTEENYRCLLELCNFIDPILLSEFAAIAKAHTDPYIREVGVEFSSAEESDP